MFITKLELVSQNAGEGLESLTPKLVEMEMSNGKVSKDILEALLTVQAQIYSMQTSAKAKEREADFKLIQIGQRSIIFFSPVIYN